MESRFKSHIIPGKYWKYYYGTSNILYNRRLNKMKYRIKQTAKKEFIPQVKRWFFGKWFSIDKDLYLWYFEEFGRPHSICSTYGEAIDVIKDYKLYLKNQSAITAAKEMFYPKYHKV